MADITAYTALRNYNHKRAFMHNSSFVGDDTAFFEYQE
jgi:hypothetical protein